MNRLKYPVYYIWIQLKEVIVVCKTLYVVICGKNGKRGKRTNWMKTFRLNSSTCVFCLTLPQQENSYDCGLSLLHYLELFLAEIPENFNPLKLTKFSNFEG
ncbi:hypothetical protein QN277_028941 [Acacia crassicarpa]|uniref:Ubiquitin-like protease family profile domain-containing protein n=1 Tax=Acacia crassicarpa TaxID=499986 RepID=A0AAE1J470_9FABA|nr:hypothetical protein QN277_028941 [Acacia crassicarpa]